jgi:hypothetical protein
MFLFISSSLAVCSCALILQGRTEKIAVNSDPPGALVTLSDGETKVTPFSITVPRNQDLQFHFSKPGYQSTDVSDNSQVEGAYGAVDIIPLMIPWAIDGSTGAPYKHQQSSVTARLDPIEVEAGPSRKSGSDATNVR